MRRERWIPALLLLAVSVWAPPAGATHPGGNGVIAFEGPRGVEAVDPDGTNRRVLVPDATEPAWSPDGSRLLYYRHAKSGYDIWVARADGSKAHRIVRRSFLFDAAWSPDGARLVTSGLERMGDLDSQLFVMSADGTERVAITPGGHSSDYAPDWSPDGSRIAFIRFEQDRPGGVLYTVEPDGSGLTRIGRGEDWADPDWSPDGKRIVGLRLGEIWTIEADGSDPTKLPTSECGDSGAVWSPDGRFLAFHSEIDCPADGRVAALDHDDPDTTSLWVMRADGTGRRRITGPTAYNPAWQPLPR